MKTLFTLFAALLLASGSLLAQTAADALMIGLGGTFAKPKIIPGMQRLAIAQVRVDYKLTSTAKVIGKEKSTGAIAGAKLTAFLETTDGKLEAPDFQEITDHFYAYLQKKLAEAGVSTVDWATIAGTEFYKSQVEREAPTSNDNSGNHWITSMAHGGNYIYAGKTGFAFGKIKKASAFCKDVDATAVALNLTVDFADVLLDVDIKSSTYNGYFTITKTRSWKYNSAVSAQMKVVPGGPYSMFWNEKDASESLYPVADIKALVPYHDEVTQDAGRMKNSMWAFSKEMTPVVIETTKAKYKAAAKSALEVYADALVAKHKNPK